VRSENALIAAHLTPLLYAIPIFSFQVGGKTQALVPAHFSPQGIAFRFRFPEYEKTRKHERKGKGLKRGKVIDIDERKGGAERRWTRVGKEIEKRM
jgi:hypothetical protein